MVFLFFLTSKNFSLCSGLKKYMAFMAGGLRVRGLGVRESAKAFVTIRYSQFSELGVRGFPKI